MMVAPSPEALALAEQIIHATAGDPKRAREAAVLVDEFARRGVERERERCGQIADEYASVNIEAAGDTILHDPVLSGRDSSPEAFDKSRELGIEGAIHSAMFHAAQNIAAAIRERTLKC